VFPGVANLEFALCPVGKGKIYFGIKKQQLCLSFVQQFLM
jgi:hypothetical protein